MADTSPRRTRLATLVSLAAITAALLVHPGASFAVPADDLAEAEAQVRSAQAAVSLAKTAVKEARAQRDTLSDRVVRHTATRDRAAVRLDDARLALSKARERVRNARIRLEDANTPQEIDAAREHLQLMRKRSAARRDAVIAAKSAFLAAQAAVDRATSALERAQARLAEARSQLESARIVLIAAKEHYAELLALSSVEVTAAVANIPNRVGPENFKRSMGLLVGQQPDFITLNEISGRTVEGLRAAAPGYGVYRGGARLTEPGAGGQSINNAVLWRTDAYKVVAQGRIKVVDDDRGYYQKKKYLWDRYATWVTLRNLGDGQVTSVISTHMPTNPEKFPRQWGDPALTRVQLYALGMDKLTALVRQLAPQGRVLLAGDMNSHPNQGYWTAVAKMRKAGYAYTKDRGVMYEFHAAEASVTRSMQVSISSDHPALVSTVFYG
ncbi:MAG TPA: endonuclease/exonuclease/phosphatase family protein [Nocardioides sp.]|nr:endonuclease/exonuclease/phosphatase family protein [Nocardioides sp.]